MRLLIVLLLSLTVASAQYAKPAPVVVQPQPAPATTCALPARLERDCDDFALKSCGPGVTSMFHRCREIVKRLCEAPRAFADEASCVREHCTGVKAAGHSDAETHQVCTGSYKTGAAGVKAACGRCVCKPAPVVVDPVPAPAPACALPAKLETDCTKFAQDCCSGGVTATFAICRRVVANLCQKPAAFETVDACVAHHCDNLEGDAGHPTETVRQVCRGTYNTKAVSAGMLKYFPTGVPAAIDGARRGCQRVVCAKPPPPPPAPTPAEIKAEPEVPPAPVLVEAYNKQQQQPKQEVPAPAPTPVYQAPKPVETPKAKTPKVEPPKPVEQPKPAPVPVVVPPAATPVATTPITQDCSVIMVDADEEDCTADLRKEVEQLEKYVDQLTILLASKGAKFTEACVVTTGTGGDKPNDKPNGGGAGGDKPNDKPNGGGGNGGDKKDDKPNGGGNGGDKPGDKPNGGGNGGDKPGDKPNGQGGNGGDKPGDKPNGGGGNGGDKPGDKPNGGGAGGDKPGDKPNGQGGAGNGKPGDKPNGQGGNGGAGGKQDFNAGAGAPTTSRSSSAGFPAMAVAGIVIGSAVAAGIVAVAIGFFVAAPAAGGAAVVSAAPMTCAATNPLYVPLTNGGENMLVA